MRFNEFIKNVEKVIARYGSITFSEPDSDNGDAFGIIEKSNLDGVFIVAREHYIGDGDTALSHIKLHNNIVDAFDYIWKMNYFHEKLGSYKNYDFRFDKVEGLWVDNCYYVLKI